MPALYIDGQNISWADTLKYFGMYFDSGKTVKVNTSRSVRQFYASANNILSHTISVNDITRLHLVETYCLPLLTYALNCIFISNSQLRKCSVCRNNLFRRIFNMHLRESVKEVQYYCGRFDFNHIVDKHRMHFFSKVDKMNTDVVQQCFSNVKRGDNFKRLCNDNGFIIHNSLLVYRPYRVYDKFCLQFQ